MKTIFVGVFLLISSQGLSWGVEQSHAPKDRTRDLYLWRTDLGIPFRVRYDLDQNLCEKYRTHRYTEIFKKNGYRISLSPTFPMSKYCVLSGLYECTQLQFDVSGDFFWCDGKAIDFDNSLIGEALDRELCSVTRYRDIRHINYKSHYFLVKKPGEHCRLTAKGLRQSGERRARKVDMTCDEVWIRDNRLLCHSGEQVVEFELSFIPKRRNNL